MSLEISRDDKIVFVGGSTNSEGHSGKAAISAVQFNQYLVHLDSKSIGNLQEGRAIFQIRRFESQTYCKGIDKGIEVLFAACFGCLTIIEWRDHFKQFVELRSIPSLHTSEIFDFAISENDEILTVCPEDDFLVSL